MSLPILVIGAGRAGLAVAAALADAGTPVRVASRSAEGRARAAQRGLATGTVTMAASAWIVAVPDDAIATTASALARAMAEGEEGTPVPPPIVALHLSGASPASVLAALAAAGVSVGTMHPLQALTHGSPRDALRGVPAAISGDAEALRRARALAESIGMRPFVIADEHRALYHAAGAFAANFSVALLDVALDLARRTDMPESLAREGFAALAAAAATRVAHEGPEGALTGPIRRGDRGAVAMHLEALDRAAPAAAALYRVLAVRALDVAHRAGLADDAVAGVRAQLTGATP